MANGNGTIKTILAVAGFVILLVGGGVGYGHLKGQVTTQIDSLTKQVDENKIARDTTIMLKVDVEHIKNELEKQDKKLDKILEKLDD